VLDEAAELWGEAGMPAQRWFARHLLVWAGAVYAPDGERMLRIAYDLIEEIEAIRPPWLWGWAHTVAGLTELLHGSPERAVDLLRVALRSQLSAQDGWGPMWSALVGAEACARVGDFDSTLDLLYAAASLRHQTGIDLQAMVPLATHAAHAEQLLRAAGRAEPVDQRHALTNDRAEAEDIIVCVVGALDPAVVPDLEEQTPALTVRQREVAELVARGMTSAEVADQLLVSVRTVENHLAHVYKRLGINNRAALPAMLAKLNRPRDRNTDLKPLRGLG
jgi:DNA-binding CsgD family transcriptional regulator